MTKRTDPHRPGAIVPADYEAAIAYNCATSQDGWPVPSFGITCGLDRRKMDATGAIIAEGACNAAHRPVCCTCEAHRRAEAAGKEVFGAPGKCGSCGAWFIYGELWLHVPTGDYVHLGHDCAQKYGLMMDRSAAELANGRHRAAIATQIRKAERAEDRAAFLAEHPGLAEAFEVGSAESNASRGAQIIADIAARFVEFASLSDKQIALVVKLANEIRNPRPPAPEEVHVPAPTGKGIDFEGVITSAKLRESDYGFTWKISIKVATPTGCWIAWGSAPAGVLEHAVAIADGERFVVPAGERVPDRGELIRRALVGMRVDVRATLEAPTSQTRTREGSRPDDHFVFMSRPNGCVVAYRHPVRSAKRLKAEAAFEKAIEVERTRMRETDDKYLGGYVVPHDDVVASLAAQGITLDGFIAASLAKPTRKRKSEGGADSGGTLTEREQREQRARWLADEREREHEVAQ